MGTLPIIYACMAVIAGAIIIYEFRIKRIRDKNKELIQRNKELENITKRLISNEENLVIDYDTLLEVAKERFADEELNRLFNQKREFAVERYMKEKDERLYKRQK